MYLFPAPHVHTSTFLALFRNYCSVTSTGAHWNITGHCFSCWHTVLQLFSPLGWVHKCPSPGGSSFGSLLLMHMGPQRVAVNYSQFLSLLLGLAKVFSRPVKSPVFSKFMTLDPFQALSFLSHHQAKPGGTIKLQKCLWITSFMFQNGNSNYESQAQIFMKCIV